jgi:hypothetical protein
VQRRNNLRDNGVTTLAKLKTLSQNDGELWRRAGVA